MLPNKRLQIFISSTYKDLIEERQAAVQAILSFGHIPAGMELFTSGDQSQMQVIKDWINQSDVFLLILGGCYGSIDPISGKSYTQIEYEYAVSIGKPTFAIVIKDDYLEAKVKKYGSKVLETQKTVKYKKFRKIVLSKIVKFFGDSKDIKLSIYETISEFSKRDDLIGWVPGNQKIDISKMAEKQAKLGEDKVEIIPFNDYWFINQWDSNCASLVGDEIIFIGTSAPKGTDGCNIDLKNILELGKTYEVSCFAKSDAGTTGRFQLWCHDKLNNEIDDSDESTPFNTPPTNGKIITLTFKAKYNKNIRIHLQYKPGKGRIVVSNVKLKTII